MAEQQDAWAETPAVSADDFEMDTGDMTTEDVNKGGLVDKEGWYHFDITDVKNELEKLNAQGKPRSPCITLQLTVLEGVPGQSPAGSKLYYRIYVGSKDGPLSDGSRKINTRFGAGLGLLVAKEIDGREVYVDAVSGETRIKASIWQRARSKQFVAKVVCEKADNANYQDKYTIPFGNAYPVDHPDVAEIPKSVEALKMIGKEGAAPKTTKKGGTTKTPPPPAGNGQAAPPAGKTTTPAAPAATPPAEDDFGDL